MIMMLTSSVLCKAMSNQTSKRVFWEFCRLQDPAEAPSKTIVTAWLFKEQWGCVAEKSKVEKDTGFVVALFLPWCGDGDEEE